MTGRFAWRSTRWRGGVIGCCVIAAALSAQPAAAQLSTMVEGTGEITAIDQRARRLTIKHGDIPGFMGAMTMEYPMTRDVRMQDYKIGQAVRFTIRRRNGVIEKLSPQ